jgi:hypothetical protein
VSEGARPVFEPDNALEEALLAALLDPAALPAFHRELAASELLIPTSEPPAPGAPRVFPLGQVGEHTGVPAYTSVTQIAHSEPPEGTSFVRLTGRELADGWDEETTLLINPGGTLGLALTAAEVRRLGKAETEE